MLYCTFTRVEIYSVFEYYVFIHRWMTSRTAAFKITMNNGGAGEGNMWGYFDVYGKILMLVWIGMLLFVIYLMMVGLD